MAKLTQQQAITQTSNVIDDAVNAIGELLRRDDMTLTRRKTLEAERRALIVLLKKMDKWSVAVAPKH